MTTYRANDLIRRSEAMAAVAGNVQDSADIATLPAVESTGKGARTMTTPPTPDRPDPIDRAEVAALIHTMRRRFSTYRVTNDPGDETQRGLTSFTNDLLERLGAIHSLVLMPAPAPVAPRIPQASPHPAHSWAEAPEPLDSPAPTLPFGWRMEPIAAKGRNYAGCYLGPEHHPRLLAIDPEGSCQWSAKYIAHDMTAIAAAIGPHTSLAEARTRLAAWLAKGGGEGQQ